MNTRKSAQFFIHSQIDEARETETTYFYLYRGTNRLTICALRRNRRATMPAPSPPSYMSCFSDTCATDAVVIVRVEVVPAVVVVVVVDEEVETASSVVVAGESPRFLILLVLLL